MITRIAVIMFALAVTVGSAGEAEKPAWKNDVTGAIIPAAPASGLAHGVAFKVEKARIENGILTLRQGKNFFADQEFMIFMFLKEGKTLDGVKFTVKPDAEFGVPHVHFRYRVAEKKTPATEMFMKGYTMILEFGTTSGGKIPGKIYLCLPDKAKSFVAGTFEAEIK